MANKFAFALGSNGLFINRHFGDSSVFRLYRKEENGALVFEAELENPFKEFDESQSHGSKTKGQGIVEFLKSHGVEAIVSRQFGPNIKIVHRHFIPIKTRVETPEEVLMLIEKNMKWIAEEWNSHSESYRMFVLKNGIVKMVVDNK